MKQIHAKHFEGIRGKPTETMLRGLYFESQALGMSASGESINDLPRKINGDKTAIHNRLDQQVENLRLGCVEHYINIVPNINVQASIYKRWSEWIILRCTLDIFPTTMLYNGELLPLVNIDLKTAGDIESDWGEYCWGEPERMDHTQMVFQNYVLREFDVALNKEMSPEVIRKGLIRRENIGMLNDVPTFYWIFDTGTKMRNKIIKINVTNDKLAELKEVIRKITAIIYEQETEYGWPVTPSYDNCHRCPLSWNNGGLCKEATVIKEI